MRMFPCGVHARDGNCGIRWPVILTNVGMGCPVTLLDTIFIGLDTGQKEKATCLERFSTRSRP
jgi:hypothetical protein